MEASPEAGGVGGRCGRRRNCRTCGQQHQPHEPHLYDYIDEVDEDITCHICLQPLVTPLDTPCGHTFCRPCLLSYLTVQQSCPVDRKPLSQQLCSPSSLVLKKLLEKLKVKCPNEDHCTSEMQRGDLEDHLKYRCPGNWVSCPHTTSGCDYRGPPRSMSTHTASCPFKDQGVSRPPVLEGQITHLEVPRTHTSLGITIVGGSDTPLRCVVVQEVFPDGLVAQDGRLQPGDQIIEVDGVDMTSATHQAVCQALRRPNSVLRLGVYRERIEAQRALLSSPAPTTPVNKGSAAHQPQPGEAMMVSLRKESNRQLGLKLGGRRTEPGIFVMEVLEGSVAAQDGRLHPHDRILAINGADVRYARLDHASTLIQESRYSVSLVVSRGTSVVDSPTGPEYQHLFRSPDPALPALHWRTKSAPERLVPRLDCHHKDINKSLGDVTDSGTEEVGLSASCESLDGRRGFNGGMVIGGSLGSLGTGHQSNEGSLASLGSTLHQSSGSLSSAARCGIQDEDSTPPALPPRPRHALAHSRSNDQLAHSRSNDQLAHSRSNDQLAHSRSNDQLATPDSANSEGLREGRGLEDSPPQDATDGSISSRLKSRRSRDVSDISELSHGFSRSLRIEGAHLHQKTVTISKGSNESLGMRIGGGLGSNEGDTPIYIANINPQGPVGKSKQVKKGDVVLSVNGQSLVGLTHGQAVALLKATAELAGVTLSLLDGPETSQGSANFVPSWLFWQKLPRSLHVSKSVVLHRAPGASLGFSIVGGADPQRGTEPIHVLFVVQSSPAAADGKLRCGDRLLAVDGHSLELVRHAAAVALLKQAGQRVHLQVVSWLGTEL
ncbi:hypothetical protein O3P69_001533 [Scylla paramamosain]|uniref:E3 ubiquitin-protein ligase LNX n=1 Tax=Scylla paramamosain TaxID=85552 RepID=A0AAW0V0K4_SCYPA